MELRNNQFLKEKGTSQVKSTKRLPALKVIPDGKGIAAHVGSRLLAEMAEFTGLTAAMSEAMAPTVLRRRRHDPGQVLVDLAVTIADGGDCLSDLSVLRNQPALFGAVASTPTASRVVDALDAETATAEPKRLRYAILHTAGRITMTGRTATLHLQREWPWARQLADAFTRLRMLSFVT